MILSSKNLQCQKEEPTPTLHTKMQTVNRLSLLMSLRELCPLQRLRKGGNGVGATAVRPTDRAATSGFLGLHSHRRGTAAFQLSAAESPTEPAPNFDKDTSSEAGQGGVGVTTAQSRQFRSHAAAHRGEKSKGGSWCKWFCSRQAHSYCGCAGTESRCSPLLRRGVE